MGEDDELLEQLKKGNEKAFEKIFNKYFDRLCLYAKSITNNHEVAEELVEDIFLQVWLNCSIKPIQFSLKKYLYQSVYNNAIKYVSRLKRNNVCLENINEENISEFHITDYPVAHLILQELEDKASLIIDSLPKHCREVYLLCHDENMKYNEIATKLNITTGTVKTQMSRAYAKLREGLKEFLYLVIITIYLRF